VRHFRLLGAAHPENGDAAIVSEDFLAVRRVCGAVVVGDELMDVVICNTRAKDHSLTCVCVRQGSEEATKRKINHKSVIFGHSNASANGPAAQKQAVNLGRCQVLRESRLAPALDKQFRPNFMQKKICL
jgi:hypothetical protein